MKYPETKKKEELQTIEESKLDISEDIKIEEEEIITEQTKSDKPLTKEIPTLTDTNQETKQQELAVDEDKEISHIKQLNQGHESIESESQNVENQEENLTNIDNKEKDLKEFGKSDGDKIVKQIDLSNADKQAEQPEKEIEQTEEEKHLKETIGLKDNDKKEPEEVVDLIVSDSQEVKRDGKGMGQMDQKQMNTLSKIKQSDLEESKAEQENIQTENLPNFDTLDREMVQTERLAEDDLTVNLEVTENSELQEENSKNENISDVGKESEDLNTKSQLQVEDILVEHQVLEDSPKIKEEGRQDAELQIKTSDQDSINSEANKNTEHSSAEINITSEDFKQQEDQFKVSTQQELFKNQETQSSVIKEIETQLFNSKSADIQEGNNNDKNIPSVCKSENASKTTKKAQKEAIDTTEIEKSEVKIQQGNKEPILDSFEENLSQEEDKIKLIIESIDTIEKCTTENDIHSQHKENKEQSSIDSTNVTLIDIGKEYQEVTETKDISKVGSENIDIECEQDVTENVKSQGCENLTTTTNDVSCSAEVDNFTEQKSLQTKQHLVNKEDTDKELETWEIVDYKDIQDLKGEEFNEKDHKSISEVKLDDRLLTDLNDTINITGIIENNSVGVNKLSVVVENKEEKVNEETNRSNIKISELEIDLDNLIEISQESNPLIVDGSEESLNLNSKAVESIGAIGSEENKIELESKESMTANLSSERDSKDPMSYIQSMSEPSKDFNEATKFMEDSVETKITETSSDVVIESVKEITVVEEQNKIKELSTDLEEKKEDNKINNLASAEIQLATLVEESTNFEIKETEFIEKETSTSDDINTLRGNQADKEKDEEPPPLPVKTIQKRHNMGFFSRLAPVPPAPASPAESKQEEKSKEKSKSFGESPESKLKGVSKKELPSKKTKDSPITKAKKYSKGSQAIKKSSIGNIETSKLLIESESTESKESELDLETKEDESKAFVDDIKNNEINVESSTKENKNKDVEAVKELVDEAVIVKQQVEECIISEPSLDTSRENPSTEELTTECVQESVRKDMTNNDISIFVTPPQVIDKPETPDSLVEEVEIKLESTSEEVEIANVSDVDSQNCESRLSWATHIEEVEALEAIETQNLLKESMSVNKETPEEIVVSNNDIIVSLESLHTKESNISSEVTEEIDVIETEVKKCEELKTPEDEDTILQYDRNNERVALDKSAENIGESHYEVSFVNEEDEGKDSSNSKYTNFEDNKEKEQNESKTIDTKGIEDHYTDIIEEITEDVEKHQVFEDACSEFYNDENNFKVEDCSSSGNLENNPNDEIKDADTISVESFESCAETVIYLDGNKEETSVVMDDIARPCSQTELIIVDDIKAQYEFEQSLIDSYLFDYTPEVIESIHIQFQTSLNVESTTEREKHMLENSGNIFIID